MAKIESYFNSEDEATIVEAIRKAEKQTSGEIKVHVEEHCFIDLLDRSAEVFGKLKMHETKLRNGTLIYIAMEDHLFSIIGDTGINNVIPKDFWDEAKDIMEENFKAGNIAKGLELGIEKVGDKLKEFFPYQDDDENELSDDISFGKI